MYRPEDGLLERCRQEYRQDIIVAGGVEVQVIPAKLSIEIDHQGQPTSFSS